MRKLLSSLFLFSLVTAGAEASVVTNTEVNNTAATAQNVDAFFSLDFSPDIGDYDFAFNTSSNTSTTIPHVTVDASGVHANNSPEYDWFSFTVPFAGALGIFDVDYAMCNPTCDFDANLQLLDSSFVQLAGNDDFSTVAGQGGSVHGFDSFIQHTFSAPGLHYIGVGRCCFMGTLGTQTDYQLQISVGGHELGGEPVPEPATLALLGGGLVAASRKLRRRRSTSPA